MQTEKPQFIPSILPLIDNYDAFIIDLWGVIHDGQNLYPQVKNTLQELKKHSKKIVFLSNAPRRASMVANALRNMGIEENLYDKIITSGEVFYKCLTHPETSFFKPNGRNYIYIGLEKDRNILENTHYEEVSHPEYAQFLLLAHSFYDNQPLTELMPILEKCLEQKLPVLCINPDKEVVRITGEEVYCAGKIAEEYRMMGGEVTYFGKPHRAVYEYSLLELAGTDKSRILAIGDNIATDIIGAARTKIASLLISGGVLKSQVGSPESNTYKHKCTEILAVAEFLPDFIAPAFC